MFIHCFCFILSDYLNFAGIWRASSAVPSDITGTKGFSGSGDDISEGKVLGDGGKTFSVHSLLGVKMLSRCFKSFPNTFEDFHRQFSIYGENFSSSHLIVASVE